MKRFLFILLFLSQFAYGSSCPFPMSGMMGQMMGMGNGMSNMMGSMPFFGSSVKKMKNQMMLKMFHQALNSPEMTKGLIVCAKGSPQMTQMMLETLAKNPVLLERMSQLMIFDSEFTKLFLELSFQYPQVNNFFYAFLTPSLYRGLTVSMAKDETVAYYVSESMKRNNRQQLYAGSRLTNIMQLLGTVEDSSDGLEKSLERFLFSTFGNFVAAENFIATMGLLDKEYAQNLIAFIFMGQTPNANYLDQSSLNVYAIAKGVVKGIVPYYHLDSPMDPESEFRGNKLMAQFFSLMVDNGTITHAGGYFFQGLIDGAFVHDDSECLALIGFLQKILPPEMFEHLPRPNPESIAPRDFIAL